jgi:ATP phosphoribosyltransferase
MLREAGYAQRSDGELALLDEANGVEFFYCARATLRCTSVRELFDVGITGRDMLLDSRAHAIEVLPLGFGRSKFRFAARQGSKDVGGAAA